MRTKTVLLSAALVAAGVASSMAQSNVYSLNIVGYVNVPVQANTFYLLANPLDDGAGDIVTNVLPLNDTFDNGSVETTIYQFDGTSVNPTETYFAGYGWYPGTNVIAPGSGFYIYPCTNSTLTFVGSVVLTNTVTLPPGFSLVGSSYPASTDLYTLGLNGGAGATDPNANPDAVYRYNPASGLSDISTYFPTYGWYEQTNNTPVDGGTGGPTNGPTLNVAEGFFYQNANSVNATWAQAFTVN